MPSTPLYICDVLVAVFLSTDHLVSVTCDFEDPFLCGYSQNASSEEKAYKWSREKGGPLNFGTGPDRDRTGNSSGKQCQVC